MKNPLRAWIDSLPPREPPYDEWGDKHPKLLTVLMIALVLIALALAVGLVGGLVTR